MKKITILLMAAVSTLLIASCKNPESEGKKVAEQSCACKTKSADDQNQANKDFLNDLENSKYTSHFSAQKKMDGLQQQAGLAAHICDSTMEAALKDAQAPYLTNQDNSEKFHFAFAAQLSDCKSTLDPAVTTKIRDKIWAMSDPKPDIDRIKLELIGMQIGIKGGGTWKFENMSQYVKTSLTEVNTRFGSEFLNYNVQMQVKDLHNNALHDCVIGIQYYQRGKWWQLNGINMQSFK